MKSNNTTRKRVWLDKLELEHIRQGFGKPGKKTSVDGNPLSIAGNKYRRGVGTHSISEWYIKLDKKGQTFHSQVGIDDEVKGKGSAEFLVVGDGRILARSGIIRGGIKAETLECSVAGIDDLFLIVTDAGDTMEMDHANWCNAWIELIDVGMKVHSLPIDQPEPIIAQTDLEEAGIHLPSVVGVQPGSPVDIHIPFTGRGPFEWTVTGLPPSLTFDSINARIQGKIDQDSEYKISLGLKTQNDFVSKEVKLLCRKNSLALTPPMGWNSWNCWGLDITEEKIIKTAKALRDSSLSRFGYQYLNIDDGWQGERNADGKIEPNNKFSSMGKLAEAIHNYGLKAGIYSSPGPKTCGGYTGSWGHEIQDAETYAEWGYDYLKYDYCSYIDVRKDHTLEAQIEPYRIMGEALLNQPRDIVFAVCTAGYYLPWKWASDVHAHLWRTTPDIYDTWGSMAGIAFCQDKYSEFQQQGRWNDPDMLVVGKVGWGPELRDTSLTENEQVAHIGHWALLGAPLLIGCNLEELDDFTFNLLTNREVLAINQDAAGNAAQVIVRDDFSEIWRKELENGDFAVGIYNRAPFQTNLKIDLKELSGFDNPKVRNCWIRKDYIDLPANWEVNLAPHESLLLRLSH